ncbi:lorien protein [Trypanosoma rangeli]|uniref:Lorien protein n=1 Tax=Trypanosoma rangeli TaxID=5698 RepID=A0A3R7KHL3_TRYRA|nr:lorien protein [Trypanosoma rangeli]RNF06645.1 lorien protein [Trypanosoma rangeli]|eukprot:RNF06645.1 lorien protein [Trypanosoma rangeli]
MVEFQPGTLLWVNCDDGEWWPAVVRKMDNDSLLVVGEGYDICVEFYHDPGNLYPVDLGNTGVRVLHRAVDERDAMEEGFFRVHATQEAVKRVLLDDTHSGGAPTEEEPPPYSPEELQCMSALLKSVNHATASQLRKTLLAQEGIDLSSRNIRQRITEKDRRRRKRPARHLEEAGPSSYDVKVVREADSNPRPAEAVAVAVPLVSDPEWTFQEAFDPAALDIVRKEVFENKERCVLSPLYRYLDLLGAVAVDGIPVETTLPTPRALHEVPGERLLESRRVLLVALSASSFEHTMGWMAPFEYEGTTIAMTLFVNGAVVKTPCNSSLPSGKEAVAVKTATVADITTHVLHKDLFSLAVGFTGYIEDISLWKGVIAAVYVDLIDMDTLEDRIVSNYKVPPRRKSRDDVVGVQVKITCPITALPLNTPVRGFLCEHMQCMELRSLLMHCARTNVWNCPLCWAPTTPETTLVNYRLKEWLETHQTQLDKVDFIIETPTGVPLRPVWKRKTARNGADVIALE